MLEQVRRNSGATLLKGLMVLKNGPGVREQGIKMQKYPEVFAPVLALVENGYVMEWYDGKSFSHGNPWIDGANLLEQLWDGPARSPSQFLTRKQYHHVLVNMATDMSQFWLAEMLESSYERVRDKQATAYNIHGDATVENLVVGDNSVRWIDPSIRPAIYDRELDAAKLLWSALGYEHGYLTSDSCPLGDYVLSKELFDRELVTYHFIGHVIRSWDKQPLRRLWFTSALNVLNNLRTL